MTISRRGNSVPSSWPRPCHPITRSVPGSSRTSSGPSSYRASRRAAPPDTLFGMAAQYIYTMRDLRRFYPPDREVLKGINLSFYPGAKIGVIGSNGSGKSSLLRIMAGEDDGFTGEARLTPGFTVGFLAQEPQLDPDQGRARQRVRRGRRDQGPGGPVQRGLRGHGRARRRLRQALGRAGRASGQDRRRRSLGPRTDLRHRHGRTAAAPA